MKHVLGLQQILQLLIPFSHEEKFQRKCILGRILVKLRKKGIVGELFQDHSGVKMTGKDMRQSCFPGTNISLNGNKVIIHQQISKGETNAIKIGQSKSFHIHELFHMKGVGTFSQQLSNCLVKNRMLPIRSQLIQGHQYKSSVL